MCVYQFNSLSMFCRELKNGIPVYDKEGNKLGVSKVNIRNIQETRCGT